MKVFYNPVEQDYHPQHSLFCGQLVPYPDVPGRTRSILDAITDHPGFEMETPPAADPDLLRTVHDTDYLETLQAVCDRLGAGEAFFPFHTAAFPLLRRSPYPRIRMGYYALDGSTPLLAQSFGTAMGAADSAVAGARAVLDGETRVYSLPRPPGHHAGRRSYAGYCLINNAALAAGLMLEAGKVAVLDVDYHHGNGTQDIFWERDDVLYVSLHCRPEEAYPYIAGSREETGAGRGQGFNLNLPLRGGTGWTDYRPALEKALEVIQRFAPAVVVLSLGFDTLVSDPIGTFKLVPEDFEPMARMIGELKQPLLVVQEGGYDVPSLGACVLRFFAGLDVG